MSVFSVPVTIGIDEEKIAKEVERNARQQAVAKIVEHVENEIYTTDYYGRRTKSTEPLRDIIKAEVAMVLSAKEDLVIELAAKILADKLAKTKAVKEKVGEILEEYEDAGDGKDE